GRLVAFDQDPENLHIVKRECMPYGVETVVGSVRQLSHGALDLGRFHHIYTPGLYDYLDQSKAQQLTASLFGMLQSGGRLLVANFIPHGPTVGYMEAFMDWHLIYRALPTLEAVAAGIPAAAIADQRTFLDERGIIAYLELHKR